MSFYYVRATTPEGNRVMISMEQVTSVIEDLSDAEHPTLDVHMVDGGHVNLDVPFQEFWDSLPDV